jgi:hypothetical protein
MFLYYIFGPFYILSSRDNQMSNEFKYGVITFKKSVHFENEKNVLIKNILIVCTNIDVI